MPCIDPIPCIDMDATGQNIKEMRESRNIKVKDLQKIFGFENPTAIYRWQEGRALPTIDNMLIMAHIFCCRIAILS